MSTFRKCYSGIVEAIVTNAVVAPAFDVTEKTISRHCYTEMLYGIQVPNLLSYPLVL